MQRNKKTVEFRANKIVKQPTTVSFSTKDGRRVTFQATRAIKKPTMVKFKAKK